MPAEVELHSWSAEPGERRGEPVTVGVPWPRGVLRDAAYLVCVGPTGEVPLQTEVLERWPDGSVRWVLCDLLLSVPGNGASGHRLKVLYTPSPLRRGGRGVRSELPIRVQLDELESSDWFILPEFGMTTFSHALTGVTYGAARICSAESDHQEGSVRTRTRFQFQGHSEILVTGFRDDFPSANAVRVQLTITNPNAAGHPGGNWDLGNEGSIFLRGLSVKVAAKGPFKISPARGQPFCDTSEVDLYQASSGGENWRSEAHLDKDREVRMPFRGYRLGSEGGLRATPIVLAGEVGITMPYFWENFPVSIQARDDGWKLPKTVHDTDAALTLGLMDEGLTEQSIELQGGEQKTHTFTVAFADTGISDEPLVWARSPLQVSCSSEWYARCEAVPHLTPKAGDPHSLYLKLVDQAIEGPDTFLHKREVIDEYGWRNFGDIYGDHEAVRHTGPAPMVSHYNNQYDCVGGFAAQFFRSGDPRWFTQMLECADHTADIDIYHTTGDKAAYNGGLFWHTYHYAPADTANHRSYPKRIRSGPQDTRVEKLDTLDEATAQKLLKAYSVGGGPAPSHVYTTGMMIAWFLTGDPRYRDTVIGLADYILNVEDPSKTVFRWLSREFTGLATDSQAGYHGPGRASANSVNALLDGFRLTGDRKYLDFAEVLIRRVAHPNQNLDALDLLNAELRWFYTMFLQALGRYLDLKVERYELDRMYDYGGRTLLHYARWMAEHERPILDAPEKLQYPTETWAAQDLRKVEVFQYAAKHTGAERERFLERAAWFFEASVAKLDTFPTKSLCRPVVLLMNFGWSRNWWKGGGSAAPLPKEAAEAGGSWTMFVPQKAKAVKRAKLLAVAGMLGFAATVAGAAAWWWG